MLSDSNVYHKDARQEQNKPGHEHWIQNLYLSSICICLTCLLLLTGIKLSIAPKGPSLSPVNQMTLLCSNYQADSAIKGNTL